MPIGKFRRYCLGDVYMICRRDEIRLWQDVGRLGSWSVGEIVRWSEADLRGDTSGRAWPHSVCRGL